MKSAKVFQLFIGCFIAFCLVTFIVIDRSIPFTSIWWILLVLFSSSAALFIYGVNRRMTEKSMLLEKFIDTAFLPRVAMIHGVSEDKVDWKLEAVSSSDVLRPIYRVKFFIQSIRFAQTQRGYKLPQPYMKFVGEEFVRLQNGQVILIR